MQFSEATKHGVINWIEFKGRSSRSEYWWFILAAVIFTTLAGISIYILKEFYPEIQNAPFIFYLIYIPPFLFLFFTVTTASVRRLHDLNLSGWWYGGYLLFSRAADRLSETHWAFSLIGICAAVAMVAVLARRGVSGENRYGPDPIEPEPAL